MIVLDKFYDVTLSDHIAHFPFIVYFYSRNSFMVNMLNLTYTSQTGMERGAEGWRGGGAGKEGWRGGVETEGTC